MNELTRGTRRWDKDYGELIFDRTDFYEMDEYKNIFRRMCNHLGAKIEECKYCTALDTLFYDEKCDIDNEIILLDLDGGSVPKIYSEIRRVNSAAHDSTLAFTFENILKCINPLLTKESFDTRIGKAPTKYGCGKLKLEIWDIEKDDSPWNKQLEIACIPWKGVYEESKKIESC